MPADPEDLISLRNRIIDMSEERFGRISNRRLVYLGSGQGFLAIEARRRGAEVVCLDSDARALSITEGPRVAADAASCPFAPKTFDGALMRSLLVWSPKRDLILQEAARVVEPGGVIAGSESLNAEIDIDVEDEGLEEVWMVIKQALGSLEPVTLSYERLQGLLASSGLQQIRVERQTSVDADWDPVWFFFGSRGPSGYSLAEYLVSGGFDERLIAGFCDGLRTKRSSLVTHEGLFVATRSLEEL
ncbi:MAG: class I SAM-dependent methyltransferase [Actinomycetota bacterium]|nr:class I SAM-dependent methyltransferase [Actinomycetota bacterium]